jgi:hypothetical protein
MKNEIEKQPEIAIFQANTLSVEGWNIYWVLSKIQIEYILHDITPLPPNAEQPHLERTQYLEETLPVLSLEKYYGLQELPTRSTYGYIVAKIPMPSGDMQKAVLRTNNPIRIRKLTFNAAEAKYTGLPEHSEDILGAFTLPENQLIVVPDIASILNMAQ